MKLQNSSTTATALRQRVGGLILMSVFTLFWASVAFFAFANSAYKFMLLIFPTLSVFFTYQAIQFGRLAKALPDEVSANPEEEKKRKRLFLIITSAEGLGIFLAVNIATNLGHPELRIPALALVVGLHFFPLAKVFKRNMDYYLGAWSTIIALVAIGLSLNKTWSPPGMLEFTGIGLAMATSIYGLNMARHLPSRCR